jgi:outer membrane protein OmpA-like peptidoglycan-associated protein
MKKTLMTLSILALLTACSSSDADRMDALESRLTNLDMTTAETMDELAATKSQMMDAEAEVTKAEKKVEAYNTFFNPESVFSKNGIMIVEENGVPTLVLPNAVTFDLNSASIRPEFKELLDTLAEAMKEYPAGKLHVEGHTDNTGTAEYNMALSKKRAESAKKYLESKGVEGDRISVEGKGQTDPRYSNATSEDRAKNRRIEVQIHK